MRSFIVAAKKRETQEQYVQKLCKQYLVNPIDVMLIEAKGEKSIGIESIRQLQKNILLKPLLGPNKAIVIYNAQALTIEAQNALLKTLEEPPPHTIILLLTHQHELFLSTIISRCTILVPTLIENNNDNQEASIDDSLFFSNDVAVQLKHAQNLSKKQQELLLWIDKAILGMREKLLEELNRSQSPNLLENSTAQKIYVRLKALSRTSILLQTTQINVRLCLENIFLNM